MSENEQYREEFHLSPDKEDNLKNLRWALEKAYEVRKLEIELYWRRTAYFWAFAALALGAYVTVAKSEPSHDKEILLLVCCFGLIASTAWWLANRGSKYWQENWEHQVEILEEPFGPLYKTQLFTLTAQHYSVTKLNLILSKIATLGFGFLLLDTLRRHFQFAWFPDFFATFCIVGTIVAVAFLALGGKSASNQPSTVHRITRQIEIQNDN